MSDSATPSSNSADRQRGESTLAGVRERAGTVLGHGRLGTIAMLAGGALLARAIRTKGRARTAVQGMAGLALVAFGVRRRLSREGTFEAGEPTGSGGSGGVGGAGDDGSAGGTVDTPARTEHGRGEANNPRDVEQEPDVETAMDPEEGRVQFSTDQDAEPGSNPHLDETEADDPRRREADDEVDVDLSEAHVADEASEAAGPDAEQAYPAQTEDTEPDESPSEDASHVEADRTATGATDEREDGPSGGAGAGGTADGDAGDGGDDVSTDDRYEGERGADGTVDDSPEEGDEGRGTDADEPGTPGDDAA